DSFRMRGEVSSVRWRRCGDLEKGIKERVRVGMVDKALGMRERMGERSWKERGVDVLGVEGLIG
ncbi:hypothetical protein, partial [Paenibacillus xylanexedens]|uniref:hypothetical protein n=1 Tax=Paenibacillus xylanexedens TaxID=528191 RepID=UPI0021B4A70F